MRTNPIKAGIAFGFLLALFHTAWVLLVALGWAQLLLDFILWAHFLKLPVAIEPFDEHRAFILIGATVIIGFLMGAALGAIWNILHPKKG